MRDVLLDGFSAQQMLEQVFAYLLADTTITDLQKSAVLLKVADTDKRLTDGCDEYLQLLSVASTITKTLCE